MLGFRGCRLSVVYPEITEMQARAVAAAAAVNKKVHRLLYSAFYGVLLYILVRTNSMPF